MAMHGISTLSPPPPRHEPTLTCDALSKGALESEAVAAAVARRAAPGNQKTAQRGKGWRSIKERTKRRRGRRKRGKRGQRQEDGDRGGRAWVTIRGYKVQ